MKKLLFVLTIAVAVLQTSCKKKEPTGGGAGTLKFTIGGTSYSYNCSAGAEAIPLLGTITITGVGTGSNANSLNIQMQGLSNGTYNVGATTNDVIMIWNTPSDTDIFEGGHGTINFTQTGGTATANFSAVLYGLHSDSVVISGGTYSGGYVSE